MARVTLELPERFGTPRCRCISAWSTTAATSTTPAADPGVRSADTLFQSLGYHHQDRAHARPQRSLVVGDMQGAVPVRSALAKPLRIDVAPRELSRCALDLVWRVSEASQGREVARGKAGLVFIDPASKRAATDPALCARSCWRCRATAALRLSRA